MNKIAKNNLLKIIGSLLIVGVLIAATLCLSACSRPATLKRTDSLGEIIPVIKDSEEATALSGLTFEYTVAEGPNAGTSSVTYADVHVSGFNSKTATEEGETRVLTISYKGAVCTVRYKVTG